MWLDDDPLRSPPTGCVNADASEGRRTTRRELCSPARSRRSSRGIGTGSTARTCERRKRGSAEPCEHGNDVAVRALQSRDDQRSPRRGVPRGRHDGPRTYASSRSQSWRRSGEPFLAWPGKRRGRRPTARNRVGHRASVLRSRHWFVFRLAAPCSAGTANPSGHLYRPGPDRRRGVRGRRSRVFLSCSFPMRAVQETTGDIPAIIIGVVAYCSLGTSGRVAYRVDLLRGHCARLASSSRSVKTKLAAD